MDLACTTGISPGENYLKKLKEAAGSASRACRFQDMMPLQLSLGYWKSLIPSPLPLPTKPKKSLHKSSTQDKLPPTEFFKNQINVNEMFLTKEQLSELLSISIKTIDRYVSMKIIPFLKVGRLVRFERNEVLAWARNASKEK